MIAIALALYSPARAESGFTPGSAGEEPVYIIGPLDGLRIDVRGERELSRTVTVRPDGYFSVPLAEDVRAAGRTPEELSRALESRFEPYVRDPLVTVTVTGARGVTDQRIRVIGAAAAPTIDAEGRGAVTAQRVGRPTEIAYRAGMTLVDVIEEVGGLSDFAAGNDAYILRGRGEAAVRRPVRLDDLVDEGDVTANVVMAPGDILVIPEGPWSGDWILQPSVGAFLTFTDNIELVPDELADPGIVFTVAPGIVLRGTTPRFAGSVDADVELRYTEVLGPNTRDVDTGLDASLNLLGATTTEVVSDTVFLDFNAAVTQQTQDSADATSVSRFVETNRGTAASASLRPFVLHRLGDYARGTLSYSLRGFRFNDQESGVNQDGRTNLTNELRYVLSSGSEFPRLGWTWTTFGRHQTRSDADDIQRFETRLSGRYPVDRSFDVTASIGYQVFRDGTRNDFNGFSWSVGGAYQPSPNLRFDASYGRSDDRPNDVGVNLLWLITPRTTLRVSYQRTLTTSEEQFSESVGALTRDPAGNIVFPDGQFFEPERGDFDFTQETQLRQLFRASFSTVQGVNQFGLSARATLQTTEPQETEENTYGADISWTRTLDAETTGQLSAGYTIRNREQRDDDTISFRARVDRNLARALEGYVSYGFQRRNSTDDNFDFTENVVTLGLIKRF